MKTQREVMIDSLVDLVDDWELDALIVGAKSYLKCRYKKMKTFEIEEEYMNFCAAQEYPETFTMKRYKMETALVKDVENWELPDLIQWARDKYEIYLRGLSNEQLDREYETFLALDESELELYLEDD